MFEVRINLTGDPALVEAMSSLAKALTGGLIAQTAPYVAQSQEIGIAKPIPHYETPAPVAPVVEPNTEETQIEKVAEPKPKKAAPAPAPEITLEDLRTRLGALARVPSKSGLVKTLITSFGVTKLPDLPVEKYPAMLKAIEEVE